AGITRWHPCVAPDVAQPRQRGRIADPKHIIELLQVYTARTFTKRKFVSVGVRAGAGVQTGSGKIVARITVFADSKRTSGVVDYDFKLKRKPSVLRAYRASISRQHRASRGG